MFRKTHLHRFALTMLATHLFSGMLVCSQEEQDKQTVLEAVKAVMNRDLPKLRQLVIQSPEIVNTSDELGRWVLIVAASNDNQPAVEFLLSHGADPNQKDSYGTTALHKASEYGYIDIVKLLLSNGAVVDNKDSYGNTPLHTAAWKGLPQVVKLLVDHGAQVYVKNEEKQTPLERAKVRLTEVFKLMHMEPYEEIIQFLEPLEEIEVLYQ